jgi:CarD family transcriptional regulator
MAPGTAERLSDSELELHDGALVVYGGHGIGRVSRDPSAGANDRVVVEFESGLSVTLPLERAQACLRPVGGAREFDRVREILRSTEGSTETSWQARTRANKEKIASGQAVALAEVVRDAVRRQESLAAGSSLSVFERELYGKARKLLAAEVAASTGTDEADAEAWIDDQLGFELGEALRRG